MKRGLLSVVAFVIATVFIQAAPMAHGAMKIEDPVRPASVRTLVQVSQAKACSAHEAEQATRGSGGHQTPPVHSAQACALGDIVRHILKTRFVGHVAASESSDGRVFDPCVPARAGPSL